MRQPCFHPTDEDLSVGTPAFHPTDEDPSVGTPAFHPTDEDPSVGTPGIWLAGGGWSIRRSRHQRKAASVLPVPVGARISALSPRAMTGQPIRCGAVGASKTARNHSAVTGWKQANGSGTAKASGAGVESGESAGRSISLEDRTFLSWRAALGWPGA